jgi:D-glycero-D-manno-heptose 1,7-bisphosphate phosphatase
MTEPPRAAVFLDRDGVLTRALVRDGRPYAPRNLDEFEVLPDAAPALAALKGAGFLLIVVTNQPDVASGLLAPPDLEEMHRRLMAALPLDEVVVCPCREEDPACTCYKPRPGMIVESASRWRIELGRSFMVGDRWRDIEAGQAAGCRTVFLDRGYTHDRRPQAPDHLVYSLQEAADKILRVGAAGAGIVVC